MGCGAAMGQDDGMEDDGLDGQRRAQLWFDGSAGRRDAVVVFGGCVSRAHRAADGIVGGNGSSMCGSAK